VSYCVERGFLLPGFGEILGYTAIRTTSFGASLGAGQSLQTLDFTRDREEVSNANASQESSTAFLYAFGALHSLAREIKRFRKAGTVPEIPSGTDACPYLLLLRRTFGSGIFY